jgi:hypothetical protein
MMAMNVISGIQSAYSNLAGNPQQSASELAPESQDVYDCRDYRAACPRLDASYSAGPRPTENAALPTVPCPAGPR